MIVRGGRKSESRHLITIRKVCVYCGSSDKVQPGYLSAARAMGEALAGRGLTLIFGGGSTGMMGALADSVLRAGGKAIGVIPALFHTPQLAHFGLTELHVVQDLHRRKAMMIEMSDAFVALPGGLGTLEELFEILTWAQIGVHSRPVGVLNVNGYFDPLLQLLEHACAEGFLYDEHQQLLLSEAEPEALLNSLQAYRPPRGPRQ